MFIAPTSHVKFLSVRRSGIQLAFDHSSSAPLLRTEKKEVFWTVLYKHLTPNGVKSLIVAMISGRSEPECPGLFMSS